jgi:hypothetical protein
MLEPGEHACGQILALAGGLARGEGVRYVGACAPLSGHK